MVVETATATEAAPTTGTTMTAGALGNPKIIKAFAYVNDITPTILEYAGFSIPVQHTKAILFIQ